jgi:hypothetical protein
MAFTHPSFEGTKAKVASVYIFDTVAACQAFSEAKRPEIVNTARQLGQESGATIKHVFVSCNDLTEADYPEDSRAGSY